MKNTILILISLLVFTGVIEGKEVTYLEYRGGIGYEVNSEVGYTGKYVQWYENGQKKIFEENYVDGELDGLGIWWYANGQKGSEENYKGGELDGLHTSWHENGQKKSERNYKGGERDGLQTYWYENGQKKYEKNYKDGELDGLGIWWYENGQKWYEENYKDGEREGLHTYWDENGQKKFEENYKDGKREGLHTNGQKRFEENHKDGTWDGLQTSWYENGQKKSEGNWKDKHKGVSEIGSEIEEMIMNLHKVKLPGSDPHDYSLPSKTTGRSTTFEYIRYLISYESFQKSLPMSIFVDGPHSREKLNFTSNTNFGHYNPEFVLYIERLINTLINNKSFISKTRKLMIKYGLLHKIWRLKEIHNIILSDENWFNYFKGNYLIMLKEKTWPQDGYREYIPKGQIYSSRYWNWAEGDYYFWIRRDIDGTRNMWINIIDTVLTAYHFKGSYAESDVE